MRNIIVADDSSTARMIIKRCLEVIGLQNANFLEGSDGLEILKLLEDNEVDLIVTDLNMPNLDGQEMLIKVKESNQKNIPVIFITSAANEARQKELLSQGAYSVLKKPVSPPKLIETLRQLIEDKTQ